MLETIAICDEINLGFRGHPGLSAMEFRQTIEAGRPHVIMTAEFVRWDKKPSIGNESWLQEYLQGKWSLDIYPVVRNQRAAAKAVLLAEGLPKITEWFSKKRAPSWYWGRKYFHVMFWPAKGALQFKRQEQGV